jgi:hypothetical protein
MRVVEQKSGTVVFGDWRDAATSFEPWVEYTGFVAGIQCGFADGYVHPQYPVSPAGGAQPTATPSGAPVDPYAMGNASKSGCQPTTGT